MIKLAELGKMSFGLRLVPDGETMQLILMLLDLWQDDNPDLMVALVPDYDRYRYEIIKRSGDNGQKKSDGI